MILTCGKPMLRRLDEYLARRREHKLNWHRYFTLIPRRIDDTRCVWLQVIERKGSTYTVRRRLPESSIVADFYRWRYDYRIPKPVHTKEDNWPGPN